MADTNTPNISLLLPDLADTFNFALHVENNFSTIDSLMGAVQCTSSTRPSNTYAGQIIYETDSKRYVQNTGTKASPTWTYMSHAALSVTASTHPTSGLSTGELIYESDTKQLAAYTGSTFQYGIFQVAPTQVLGGTQASVTFSSIPAVRKLMLTWIAKTDQAAAQDLKMQIDGATTNYQSAKIQGRAGAATVVTTATTYAPIAVLPSNANAHYFGSGVTEIQGWASTLAYLSYSSQNSAFDSTSSYWTEIYNGQYLAVGPHTSITLSPGAGNFVAGSEFSLYGIN